MSSSFLAGSVLLYIDRYSRTYPGRESRVVGTLGQMPPMSKRFILFLGLFNQRDLVIMVRGTEIRLPRCLAHSLLVERVVVEALPC